MADNSQAEAGPSAQKALVQNRSRSRACLHCRRRKMRCDGVKPACFQCVRAERGSECEYDDGTTKTQTQLLYERLQFLEKRLRELQAAKGNAKGRPSSRSEVASNRRSNRNGRSPMPSFQTGAQPGHPYAYHDRQTGHNDLTSFSYTVPGDSSSRSPSLSAHSEGSLTPPSTTSSALSLPAPMPTSLHGQHHADYVQHIPSQYAAPHGYGFGVQHDTTTHFSYGHPVDEMANINLNSPDLLGLPVSRPISNIGSGRSRFYNGAPILLPNGQELPQEICRNLFDICFIHGHQVGFTPLPSTIRNPNLDGVPIAARYATCLWGAHFSNKERYMVLKPWFLQCTMEELPALMQLAQSGRSKQINVDGTEPLDAPLRVCQAIQVSTVLAAYLYAHDRPIEGAYHASAAARLVSATGLHKTQLMPPTPTPVARDYERFSSSQQYSNFPITPISTNTGILAPPKTETEALRRLYAFWNCFIVQRSWGAAGGISASPWTISSTLCNDVERNYISAPWPEDWGLFGPEDHLVTPTSKMPESDRRPHKGTPYENFIMGHDFGSQYRFEMRAKSAVLFDLAARLGEERESSTNCPVYTFAIATLQKVLAGFIARLPSLQTLVFSPTTYVEYTLFTTHSMAHAAVIRLHYFAAGKAYELGYVDGMSNYIVKNGFEGQKAVRDGLLAYDAMILQEGGHLEQESRCLRDPIPDDSDMVKPAVDAGRMMACLDKCIFSAREIVKVIQQIAPDQYSYLEPVICHCWTLAAKVFLRELKRMLILAKRYAAPPSSPRVQSEDRNVREQLEIVLTGLQRFGAVFPIGIAHAQKIEARLKSLSYP